MVSSYFKESFILITLQIINIIFSLLSTLYLASHLEPSQYSLIIFYTIIINIYSALSFLGVETLLIRNVLYWKKTKRIVRLKLLAIKALGARILMSILLFPLILIYVIIIDNKSDLNGIFLISISITGIFYAIINYSVLLLRSYNKYLLSFIIIILGTVISKSIAISMYLIGGFDSFLIALVLSPVFVLIICISMIKNYTGLPRFKFRIISKHLKYKSFTISAWLKYIRGYSDTLLVSLLFNAEILSTYGLSKQIFEIGKSVTESLLDPAIQRLVKIKDEIRLVKHAFFKIKVISWIFSTVVLILLYVVYPFINEIISILSLEKYPLLNIFIVISILSVSINIIYKPYMSFLGLFLKPASLVKIDFFIIFIYLIIFTAGAFFYGDIGLALSKFIFESTLVFLYLVVSYNWVLMNENHSCNV